MRVLAGTKRKVLVGVVALGIVGTGIVSASNFGFIQQLENILGKSGDRAAELTAGQVTTKSGNTTYEELIKADVNAAAQTAVSEFGKHYGSEVATGNNETKAHYDAIKADLDKAVNDAIADGKTKITNAVDAKVSANKVSIENAAVDAINAQLNKESVITGTDTVSR